MLVDLGRNDLGRVSRPGTVTVSKYMEVERYSHVLHLVSHVEGPAAAGPRRARRAPGGVPGRHAVRRPEGPGDAADRRGRGRAARAVRRRRRLPRLRRQPRHGDHDPERRPPRAARPTSTPAPGSSRPACPRRSSRRPSTRRRRCAGRSSWPSSRPTRRAARSEPAGRRREPAMILVIDNYDSFTFNLVQALEAAGADVRVVRNDAIDQAGVEALAADPERGPAGDRRLAGPGRPGVGRRLGRHDRGRPRPRDPAARRLPRDAVDGRRVRRVDRPRPDARPRRGVRGHPRRSRAAGRDAAVVPGRPLPLAGGRSRRRCRRSCGSPR